MIFLIIFFFLAKKPRYVRVNTLLCTTDEIIKVFRNSGWIFIPSQKNYSEFLEVVLKLDSNSFTKDFHVKDLLVFPEDAHFYGNDLYHNGSILLQDKASCLPAILLNPKPNSVVLDMCAAPGMKTTHLSALMKNKGHIYAIEINPKRYTKMCEIIKNSGCTNVTTVNADALKLNNTENYTFDWCKDVEYILVDPSCSGSGIVSRPEMYLNAKNESKRLKKLHSFQLKLLKHALSNFSKVKRVVYSTCSIHPQENEHVVESVLNMMNEISGTDQQKFKLAEPLKETWPRRGSDDFEHGRFCIFCDPENDLTNGFFVAVFERD